MVELNIIFKFSHSSKSICWYYLLTQ